MTLKQFARHANLLTCREVEKVLLLGFYHSQVRELRDFTLKMVETWFGELQLAAPNRSRLRETLRKSKSFIRGENADSFRLHARAREALTQRFPDLGDSFEEVVAGDSILPAGLCDNTRGFIKSLADQINGSYEQNIFDGCAVLMRRLLEILLILTYRCKSMESRIQRSDGSHKSLDSIIKDAVTNSQLALSSDARQSLSGFRTLGNFSAHRIEYNCRRGDIRKVIPRYRVTIEELLYKAELHT